jgi:hypothetical protein
MNFSERSIAALVLALVLVVDCHSQVAAPASLPPCLIQFSSGGPNLEGVNQTRSRLILYKSNQTYTVIDWSYSNNFVPGTMTPVSGSFAYAVDPQNSAHATITYGGGALPDDELYFTAVDSGSQSPPGITVLGAGYAFFALSPMQSASGCSAVSSRCELAAGGTSIAGFIVESAGPRWVLLRAEGASLGKYGVPDGVSSPSFTLHDSTGTVVGTSSVWSSDPNLVSGYETLFSLVGDFPLESGSDEGVLLVQLDPGAYTAVFKAGSAGTILCDVYILPF